MNTIRLQQAIFTSVCARAVQGYHLVARSPELGEDVAGLLCHWSPAHNGLFASQADASSLNYFRVDRQRFAISRTTYGGPEYSGRGGLQLVTRIIVGNVGGLAAYHNHTLALAEQLHSSGYLRWMIPESEWLEPIEWIPSELPRLELAEKDEWVERSVEALTQASRIAIVGATRPSRVLSAVFDRLPPDQRLDLSFATGLKPSNLRPFRVQCFPTIDNRLRAYLEQERILLVRPATYSPVSA